MGGLAYLRNGDFVKAIEISEAGLDRFPMQQQCRYHLGVAVYMEAVRTCHRALPVSRAHQLRPHKDSLSHEQFDFCKKWLGRACEALRMVRQSKEGQKRMPERCAGKLRS